jgi:hypothetical protein
MNLKDVNVKKINPFFCNKSMAKTLGEKSDLTYIVRLLEIGYNNENLVMKYSRLF